MADNTNINTSGANASQEAVSSTNTTTTTTLPPQPSLSSPPSLFCSVGTEETSLTDDDLRKYLYGFLDSVGGHNRQDILILPPDYTRFHSQAGKLTQMICEYYNFIPTSTSSSTPAAADDDDDDDNDKPSRPDKKAKVEQEKEPPKIQILPALGTHVPMTNEQIRRMFGTELGKKAAMDDDDDHQQQSSKQDKTFLVHDWRNDVITIGEVPCEMVSEATYGMVKDKPWPAQLNKIIWSKRHAGTSSSGSAAAAAAATEGDDDAVSQQQQQQQQQHQSKPLVISIGQVVPHEVMGMANYNKNIFVGCGGLDSINLSHFIGAVHGMEKMMGRAHNPLREILNYASQQFLEKEIDLWYILTVISPDNNTTATATATTEAAASGTERETGGGGGGELRVRGLYIGRDIQCYSDACDLSLKVNFTLLDRPVKKMVAYLDPDEFHSTWLGNKAIYRTRMAMADGGDLVILASGIERCGEDDEADKLIRKYGYKGTPTTMKAMEDNEELRDNLSVVAHLIHGSTEGRFTVTYCPGHLSKQEIESVGFQYGDLHEYSTKYDITKLRDGWHSQNQTDDGDNGNGEFFFISNPALGLWAVKSRFEE